MHWDRFAFAATCSTDDRWTGRSGGGYRYLFDSKIRADVQQIAQMKVRGLVPNFDNPASVTGAKSARRSKEPFTSHAVTRRW